MCVLECLAMRQDIRDRPVVKRSIGRMDGWQVMVRTALSVSVSVVVNRYPCPAPRHGFRGVSFACVDTIEDMSPGSNDRALSCS